MDSQADLESLAEKYIRDGYKVKIRPTPDELPSFARGSAVDLFAEKDRDFVMLTLMDRGDPEVVVAIDEGLAYVGSLILEAEQMMHAKAWRSGLMMAWAAVEAAGREVLRENHVELTHQSLREMLQTLHKIGKLSEVEVNTLLYSLTIRNTIAHGMRPDHLSPDVIPLLIDVARRLVRTAPDRARVNESVFLSILGDRLSQESPIRGLVDRPNAILKDILGRSQGIVTATWDRAEDARGKPVITLSLSDFTGSVTTTFSPPELTDENQMRFRLNRLWGDLLRIRSHKEIEAVLRTAGGIENG